MAQIRITRLQREVLRSIAANPSARGALDLAEALQLPRASLRRSRSCLIDKGLIQFDGNRYVTTDAGRALLAPTTTTTTTRS